ncbi:probable carboxylesterase 2 [Phragmites australis]|uniref:probable carboxylesterase 2 n=1 Tax=Phragmites australis TaxID=29695 RepID=UPI002D79156F|nr:probable carboxylesterase 2 [Phragmites australis]
MDPDAEVTFEFVPVIRQYKSGRVERLLPTNRVPPSVDATTGVASKDVGIDPATGLWARLYLPDLSECPGGADRRLPVVLYFHGGGFVVGSAADAPDHAFLNRLAARAGALAVSVEYRLAPEHPIPACYDDAWTALRWAADAADADPWVRDHGDVGRVFVLGFSVGGNIAHNVTLRAGSEPAELPGGGRVKGMALLHPCFLSGNKKEGEVKLAWVRAKLEEMWAFACGGRTPGTDDPRVNPLADGAPSLRRLGCEQVLVCVADDELEVRGKAYYQGLLASGWAKEDAELLDSAGEEHEFHLREPESAKALLLVDRLVALIRGNP